MTYYECPGHDYYEMCEGCPERQECNEYMEYIENRTCEYEFYEYGEEGYPDNDMEVEYVRGYEEELYC